MLMRPNPEPSRGSTQEEENTMLRVLVSAIVALAFAATAAVAAPPDQGSGKNEGGKKVNVFAGNPNERPGANAL